MKTPAAIPFGQTDLQEIDALRGYAILFVIVVHSLGHVPELVWPAKRLLSLGFYGVQLFFIASAVTLLMSWHRSTEPLHRRATKFFIRRFFRIAPLYYLAIPIYWIAYQANWNDFNSEILLANLLFINAWSPYLIPTVPGWTFVPGGWSISVEFCFYLIFPIAALLVTTMQRAIIFFAISVTCMIVSSTYGLDFYPELNTEERANFLYFLPLNHLVVFSIGFILYHAMQSQRTYRRIIELPVSTNTASLILCALLLGVSFYGIRKFFDLATGLPPTHLLISLIFLGWCLILLIKRGGLAINTPVANLGKVSFSAYILHFMVLKYVSLALFHTWPYEKTGIFSIPYLAVLVGASIVITYWISKLSYRLIETKFINLGKIIIDGLFTKPKSSSEDI